MSENIQYDVFLSHGSKDKAVVRDVAERLRADGVKVWHDDWEIKAGDSIPAKIDPPSLRSYAGTGEGREQSQFGFRISDFGFAEPGMSANAFRSGWAHLESHTFRFRDPLNKERRFICSRDRGLHSQPTRSHLPRHLQ